MDDGQIDRYFLLPRHNELAEEVTAFAEEYIRPCIPDLERSSEVDVDLVRLIARRGWIGVTIPTEFGGLGLGHRDKLVIIDGLSRVSAAVGAAAQASDIAVAKFLHFGNATQKKRWLPLLASGECLATIAVTEETSGGYVLGMHATAHRDGEGYVLKGHKSFIGNSHAADLHGVVVRTADHALTAFIVESGRTGLSLRENPQTMGLHGFSFGDIDFDNVWVPAENRLGAEGEGRDVAYSSSILYGRLNIAAVALGLHHCMVEATADYAFGHPRLSCHETVQQRVGQMQSNLMTARQAVYHAAWLLDRGEACDAELYNAKLVSVDLARASARLAGEVFAARALRTAHSIERYIRDAEHFWAPAGTGDVQRYRLWQFATGTAKTSWSQRLADQRIHD